MIGGKRIEPGTYDVFVELKEPALDAHPLDPADAGEVRRDDKTKIWGAYGYDPKFDVVRVPMTMMTPKASIDQFTIGFVDMTDAGGKLALAWDKTAARRSVHGRAVSVACKCLSRRGRGHRSPSPASSCASSPRRALAQERAIPFWPDAVPAAIHAEIDGVAALETVRELGRFHRVQGSPGFAAAAEHMRKKAVAAGLSDARSSTSPPTGRRSTRTSARTCGWDPVSAHARGGLAARSASSRPSRTCPSRSPTTARTPTSRPSSWTSAPARGQADYEGKDVRGKLVLADGDASRRAPPRLRGAGRRGLSVRLSRTSTTPWSGDDRDLIRWGHLSPYQLQNRFAFMVSKRQAEDFRARLSAGEKIVLRARVSREDGPGDLRRRRRDDPGHGSRRRARSS